MTERDVAKDASTESTLQVRLHQKLAKLILDIGALVAADASRSGNRAPHRGEWETSLRPQLQKIWIEHDAHRDDWIQPLVPVEAVVADGLVMSHVAIRLSLKNRIIIGALREHRNFDAEAIEEFARTEMLRLAAESDQTANRLDPIVDALPPGDRGSLAQQLEREEQIRRPIVHRALADALRAASDDSTLLVAMVAQARQDAADEFGRAVSNAVARPTPAPDIGYAMRRASRIRALVRVDLRKLHRARSDVPRRRRDQWISTRSRH